VTWACSIDLTEQNRLKGIGFGWPDSHPFPAACTFLIHFHWKQTSFLQFSNTTWFLQTRKSDVAKSEIAVVFPSTGISCGSSRQSQIFVHFLKDSKSEIVVFVLFHFVCNCFYKLIVWVFLHISLFPYLTFIEIPFRFVGTPKKNLKWKLCKTVGCYSTLADVNMGPVNVKSQPSLRGRGLVNSNFGQVVPSTDDRRTDE